eukprot:XP_011428408.1 PREDICTED: nacrein-like [Crassostrea gigas]
MLRYCFCFLVVLQFFLQRFSAAQSTQCFESDCNKGKFNYNPSSCLGPPFWAVLTPCWFVCIFTSQSPVNIRTFDSSRQTGLGAFTFNRNDDLQFPVAITNKGFKSEYKVNVSPQILLSNLNQFGLSGKSFKFESFHFHAGTSSSSVGSEHSFNNVFQPMEVHLVFYNTQYGDFKTALGQSDGLVVISVLVQENQASGNTPFSGCVNTQANVLSNALENDLPLVQAYPAAGSGTGPVITNNIALKDILPTNQSDYYTYRGSLTTPPCSQSVTWVVMRCPIILSQQAIADFKNLEVSSSGEKLGVHGNRRPVQRGQLFTSFALLRNF